MAKSTGIMLAVGGVTIVNQTIVNQKSLDFRVVIATGISAAALALVEKLSEPLAVGLAWISLATVLLVRTNPKTPSPIESFNTFWKGK